MVKARLGRSHGMGIEAQLAADMLLPWADAHIQDSSYSLSPLLAGLPNAEGKIRATVMGNDPKAFYERLETFLGDEGFIRQVRAVRRARDSASALVVATELGCRIRVHRLAFGYSTRALSALTDVDPTWIEAAEMDSRFLARLSLIQVARLCQVLGITFIENGEGSAASFPFVAPAETAPSNLLAAAEEFARYSLLGSTAPPRRPMGDDGLMAGWHDWLAHRKLTVCASPVPDVQVSLEPIRVFLCPPVSNVLPSEKASLECVLREIENALKKSGKPVAIETPRVQVSGRRDLGPTIYLKRVAALANTDLAILPLDPASTGVGVMLQLLHNATIPCLGVTANWKGISRMVRGLAPSRMSYLEYSSPGALGHLLEEWFEKNADGIRKSRARRRGAFQLLDGIGFRRAIELNHLVNDEPGDWRKSLPFLRAEFLDQMSTEKETLGTMTLLQLAYIAYAQKLRLIPSPCRFLALEPSLKELPTNARGNERVTAAIKASLANLWDAVEAIQPRIEESKIRHEWLKYLDELSPEAARTTLDPARTQRGAPTACDLTRSKEQWRRVLRASTGDLL